MKDKYESTNETMVGTYLVCDAYNKSERPHKTSELGWQAEPLHSLEINSLSFLIISSLEIEEDIPTVFITEYNHYAIVEMRSKTDSFEWRLDMDKKLFPHEISETNKVLEFKVQEEVELTWKSTRYNGEVNILVLTP
ncbi:MAG: hypothetical protein COA33_008925 [Fluviicola sp.]|nr:hypothetical protein [Fluviicola sp.]